MRILVVGCGKAGSTIVRKLSSEGHDVAVVDVDSNVIEDISNDADVLGIVGNGASYSVQKEAGIEDTNLLIAVTDSDELNLLCCLIAKKAGDCSTIARVRNPIYNREISFLKEELGLSMTINPEQAAATEIARILRFPSAIKIETFAKGRVEILKFIVPQNSMLDGMSLLELQKQGQEEVLVCAVERGDDIVIPNGQFKLKIGDVVSLLAAPRHAKGFFTRIGIDIHRVRNVMIAGGGKIAYYLAEQLLVRGIEVKIIEQNRDRCEELAELLPKAVIINGNATDHNLLMEEGLENYEAFVTLTGIDEENVILSLYAQMNSKAKIITKTDRVNVDFIANKMNIGTMIHPKDLTAEYILRYVRAMQNGIGSNVETLYNIVDGKAEALEFLIRENCPIANIPLAQLRTKENVLIAAIARGPQIIIPNGQTSIQTGDTVVVVTEHQGFGDIKDILQD